MLIFVLIVVFIAYVIAACVLLAIWGFKTFQKQIQARRKVTNSRQFTQPFRTQLKTSDRKNQEENQVKSSLTSSRNYFTRSLDVTLQAKPTHITWEKQAKRFVHKTTDRVYRKNNRFLKKRKSSSSDRHDRNIVRSERVLVKIRSLELSDEKELPVVLGILRREIDPYQLEELVLTCFSQFGYSIQRNARYSGDAGIDGRVFINAKLYLIQVKQYSGHISIQHIRDFRRSIERENATGGFFVHTGITRKSSKEEIADIEELYLLSGQRLVSFIRGKDIKIVGVNC